MADEFVDTKGKQCNAKAEMEAPKTGRSYLSEDNGTEIGDELCIYASPCEHGLVPRQPWRAAF